MPQTYMHAISVCESSGITNAVSVAWLKLQVTHFVCLGNYMSQYSTKSIKKKSTITNVASYSKEILPIRDF